MCPSFLSYFVHFISLSVYESVCLTFAHNTGLPENLPQGPHMSTGIEVYKFIEYRGACRENWWTAGPVRDTSAKALISLAEEVKLETAHRLLSATQ